VPDLVEKLVFLLNDSKILSLASRLKSHAVLIMNLETQSSQKVSHRICKNQ